jgi:glyoxylase-like metal-dependent hydrolase (beta-lactamase superfamily II)
MNITHLYSNLYEAVFDCNGHYIKQVIYFILEGSKALLIDTGYKSEAEELKSYFDERNIEAEKFIITHYHDDHFTGLKTFRQSCQKPVIIGSEQFKKTLEKDYRDDFLNDTEIYPTVLSENLTFTFGGHKIRFEEAKGHSHCSIHTILDEKYIHVADNIIFDTNNISSLPLPCASIKDHFETLSQLKKHSGKSFIGSHFDSGVNGQKDMLKEIEARIIYMQRILDYQGKVEYELIKDTLPVEFSPIWHKLMLKYYKEQMA